MAHFAKVNKQTKLVEQVIVATQAFIFTLPDHEDWIQTSYNANIRKNFAGIGYTYDEQRDAFIPPKLQDNYIFDEEKCRWVPPVPYPAGAEPGEFHWNPQTNEWEA